MTQCPIPYTNLVLIYKEERRACKKRFNFIDLLTIFKVEI